MNLRRNTEAINHFVDRYKQHSDEPLLKGLLKKDIHRKYTHRKDTKITLKHKKKYSTSLIKKRNAN